MNQMKASIGERIFKAGDRVEVSMRGTGFANDVWRAGVVNATTATGAHVKFDGGGVSHFYFARLRPEPKRVAPLQPWVNPKPVAAPTPAPTPTPASKVTPLRHFEAKDPPAPAPPLPTPPAPKKKRNVQHAGKELPAAMRAFLVAKVRVRGTDAVKDLEEIDPHGPARSATIWSLLHDQTHRWSKRNFSVLFELARRYGYQETAEPPPQLPDPVEPSTAPESDQEQPQSATPTDPVTRALKIALDSAVAAENWSEVAQLSKELRNRVATVSHDGPQEPFAQKKAVIQREILAGMHHRFADRLRAGGVTGNPLSAAWRISYDAFERETGKHCCRRASAESDAKGTKIQPLDIIEREGEIVRFHEIVCRTWEGV